MSKTADYRILARFWSKVAVKRDGVCWEWQAVKTPAGYGTFYVPSANGPQAHGAHRFAFETASGETIPSGMFVCHRCDNPGCVNPAHLFLGSQKDNMGDAWRKGRLPAPPVMRGEENPQKKNPHQTAKGSRTASAFLTEAQVLSILQKRAAGASITELMAEYGASKSTVGFIVTGKTWKHVHAHPEAPSLTELLSVREHKLSNHKISAEDAQAIKAALDSGETGRSIAARYGLSPSSITHIKQGKTWS